VDSRGAARPHLDCRIRGQNVDDGVGDCFRSEIRQLSDHVFVVTGHAFQELGANHPGTDALNNQNSSIIFFGIVTYRDLDATLLLHQLQPQTLRQGRDGELGRRVDVEARHVVHHVASNRVQVDDVSVDVVLFHHFDGLSGADAQRQDVNVEHFAPHLGVAILKGRVGWDS
jgi:hypothetical protein